MYIRAEVYPGSKKVLIKKKLKENDWLITVKEPAERNLANKKIKELIAEVYGVRAKDLRIIAGHHSTRKILSLDETKIT